MAERAENIKRIMSSFLRMVGGRISWIAGVLHIRNEEDTDYQDVAAKKAELSSLSLKNSNRTQEINLTANPSVDYNLILPSNKPVIGSKLEVIDDLGNTEWLNKPVVEGIAQIDYFISTDLQTTFTFSSIPKDYSSVNLFVNGILYNNGIDFIASGANAVWQNIDFVLEVGDIITLEYYK